MYLSLRQYWKMSNNVPAKIKPIGTLQDFSATHMGHYETFLLGLVGGIWDITRLFPWTLTHFLVKDFSSMHVTSSFSPPTC